MAEIEFFSTPRILGQFAKWQRILDRKETGSILFLPQTDKIYRINHFRKWQQDRGYEAVKVVDLVADTSLEIGDDFDALRAAGEFFAVYPGEILLRDRQLLLRHFLDLYVKEGVSYLYLFEMLPETFVTDFLVRSNTALRENMLLYSLYSKEEIGQFLRYLEKRWQTDLSEFYRKTDLIYAETGGYLWLVKELARQFVDRGVIPEEGLRSEIYRQKSEEIWQKFDPKTQKAIYSAFGRAADGEERRVSQLEKYGLMSSDFRHNIPESLYRVAIAGRKRELTITDSCIVFRSVDISGKFSKRELLLLDLLDKKEAEAVTREEIARIYWGSNWEERYSDWAIDQSISRLRGKLAELEIPRKIITVHNVGYEFD